MSTDHNDPPPSSNLDMAYVALCLVTVICVIYINALRPLLVEAGPK